MEREPFFAQSLNLVPRSLLPNRTETLATQTTTSPNGELPRMLPNKSILPLRRSVFIGPPARATPNREMSRVYVKKRTKWRTEPPACPSPFQWGRLFPFAGSGRVISGLLVDRFRSWFGTNTSLTYCVELLALYLSNTVIR